MQLILVFVIGAIFGLVFAPKTFSINLTTKDETPKEQKTWLSDKEVNEMIGPENQELSNIEDINKNDIMANVSDAINAMFEQEDDLYDK